MKYDFNTNSHYLTYAFSLYKVGTMYFLSSGVKGLTSDFCFTFYNQLAFSICRIFSFLDVVTLCRSAQVSRVCNVQ